MYRSIALISPQSDFSLDGLERAFRIHLEGLQVMRGGTRFRISVDRWEMTLTMYSGAEVLEESGEIARRYAAGRPDRDVIASCERRLEIQGGTDPHKNHCNDYIVVLECLEAFAGVKVFDPHTHEWI
jgi:hypothetical protein